MKSFELTPSFENIYDNFTRDTIGRDQDVWDFCRILDSIDGSYCIAIDGSWGCGKTFFIKQAKMVLDTLNPNIEREELTEEKRKMIIYDCNRLSRGKDVELQPQVCVYYDAWRNDNDVDPILSIVYSIVSEIECDFNFSSDKNKIFDIVSAIFECIKGINIKSIVESLEKHSILDAIQSEKELERKIAEFFDSLLPEKGQRLVIFVDELDRCKPSYAIQILERIKHYFGNDRITFVFSINAKELEHTISSYYGADFDSGRYLDRFFDLRIALPKPNMDYFFQSIDFSDTNRLYDIVCKAFIKTYNLSMREIARYASSTKLEESHFRSEIYHTSSTDYAKMTVLPIMIGLKILNASLYDSFINGNNSKPLIDVAKNVPEGCFRFLLSQNEVYDKKTNDSQIEVQLEDRLNEYYHILFSPTLPPAKYGLIQVGSIEIESDTSTLLKHAASGLECFEDSKIKR